jgi:hypothetical protein
MWGEEDVTPPLLAPESFKRMTFCFLATCLLGQEWVGTFNNVFEVGFAIGLDETCHFGDLDGFASVSVCEE